MKSAVRNWDCLQGMLAAAVMSVVEGVFLPQEVAHPQAQERPPLPLDPLLAPREAMFLQAAEAQGVAPEAGAHAAAPEKISDTAPFFLYSQL